MTNDPYAGKFWRKSFDPHVKTHFDYPGHKMFHDLFLEAVSEVPDITAVNYMGKEITFRQIDALSNRFAAFLIKQGLEPGDVVGVYSLNLPAYYIAIPAISKAGCVLTGVSPLLTPRELEYQLNDSGAKLLLALDVFWGNISQVTDKVKLKTIALTGFSDFLPDAQPLKLPESSIPVVRFTDIMQEYPADPVNVRVKGEDPLLMQYTGGTTGPSKGAVLTHNNVVRHMIQWGNYVDAVKGQERILCPFPLFHQAGLFLGLFCLVWATPQVAIPNPRDYDFIIKCIKEYKPSVLTAVPTIYLELMKKPEFRALDFSGIWGCIAGAAPFPVEYLKEFEDIVGKDKFSEVYGMTETCPLIAANPRYGKRKFGSVGLPVGDTEVKIVDPATNEPVPIGEPGELAVRGPQVMKGYHNKPEETANAFRDGWFHTGDICRMDDEGYIYIVDRLKDMVIVSGYKVFTRELDDIIMEHPDVALAASIGVPDPNRPGNETVASAIVLKEGVEKSEAEKEKIREFIRAREAPYKVPKIIVFYDSLPTSAVGKILKRKLREMLKAG
ncbi:MAG: AMP-binding protein [Dehalococcoidia bacterium]|jgi:acyl-CoA synthetase (AMP-forming)/AMP-acid ligase II